MFKFINRVRQFDFRKLTPLQMIVAFAGGIVILWLVAQVLSILLTILNFAMPVAAAVLIGYLAYNWFGSRSEDIPEEATKSQREKEVEKAVEIVKAVQSGEIIDLEEEEDEAEEEQGEVVEEKEFDLQVKQVVNPETGFKEPDISRLVEHEETKLKEADRVNEEILSQIEERRRRLRGKS